MFKFIENIFFLIVHRIGFFIMFVMMLVMLRIEKNTRR